EPVFRIRDHRIVRIFLREILHGLFGQRIVLALHVADAEIEFVARRGRGRQRRQRGGGRLRRWHSGNGRARADAAEVERLTRAAAAGSADRGLVADRHLPAAKRLRRAGCVRILRGIERIAAAAVADWRCRLLHDRRGGGDLRLAIRALRRLLIARLRRRIAALLRVGGLPVAGIGLRRRSCGYIGLGGWLGARRSRR